MKACIFIYMPFIMQIIIISNNKEYNFNILNFINTLIRISCKEVSK